MNLKTIKKTILFSALIMFVACQTERANEDVGVEEVLTYVAGNLSAEQGCEIPFVQDSSGNTLAYRMRDSCALESIDNYKSYIDGVKNTLDSLAPGAYPSPEQNLIYGIGIDMDEIKRIIKASRFNNNDSLYVMMGIMPNGGTGMVFALESQETIGDPKEWQFFDFTRPCPNSCPQWFDQPNSFK